MATTGSATSRSRSRFDRLALALGWACAVAVVSACNGEGRETQAEASVSGEGQRVTLAPGIVEHLMARDGLDRAQARAKALDTLRLVAVRRAELAAHQPPPAHPDDLDPARRDQLERATAVRLWLDEQFEPTHGAKDIPSRVIDANMADPTMTRRLFHPRLWFVCQALIVPADKGDDDRHLQPPSEPEAARAWQAQAEAAIAPLIARVERFRPDLLADASCEVFARMVGTSERLFESPVGPLALRYERFAFAPSQADSFDPRWVERVAAYTEPTIIAPFTTQFGLHLVIVSKVEDAQLADGSLPAAELDAARRALLREEIETPWRGESLAESLAAFRDRRVVRMGQELEAR